MEDGSIRRNVDVQEEKKYQNVKAHEEQGVNIAEKFGKDVAEWYLAKKVKEIKKLEADLSNDEDIEDASQNLEKGV